MFSREVYLAFGYKIPPLFTHHSFEAKPQEAQTKLYRCHYSYLFDRKYMYYALPSCKNSC